jgi:hypothetical protein
MNPANAEQAYTGFHWGRQPSRNVRVGVSPLPDKLVQLGRLEAVTYSTKKGGEGLQHYEHAFGETGKRKPNLAMDARTKRLHIVGGGYSVEDRGIVD